LGLQIATISARRYFGTLQVWAKSQKRHSENHALTKLEKNVPDPNMVGRIGRTQAISRNLHPTAF
jgi:hypothetical protein